MRILHFLALLSLTCSTASIAGQTISARDSAVKAAENYIYQKLGNGSQYRVEVEVNAIDDRVDVPVCPQTLDASASEEALLQNLVTVKISCDSIGWYYYLTAQVREMEKVVVISETLSPGTLLGPDNLQVTRVDKRTLHSSTYQSLDEVDGARAKRRLRPGQPLTPSNICFVCKGDSVVIIANTFGLEVKASGVALEDGNIGETIKVRNSNSNKMIEAQIASMNEVQVNI